VQEFTVPIILPRADKVVIPESKLKYSMEQDINKSRLWNSILGYTYPKDAALVRTQIKEGVLKYGCVQNKTDKYGNHYYVVILMISHDNIEKQETRLTTLYPLAEKKE
jgi:hypothetical protein